MRLIPLPPIETLRDLFLYEPDTGYLIRRKSIKMVKAGDIAGCVRAGTHRFVKVDSKAYAEHRICWALYYGEEPSGMIDHVNGNHGDNRITNLRIATFNQNQWNTKRRIDNTSGYKGVFNKNGRFQAYINCNGKRHHLGCYSTAEDAHRAYVDAAKRLHGEFALPFGRAGQ